MYESKEIEEIINKIEIEGNIKVNDYFKKRIITNILEYNIPAEKQEEIIEIIIDNSIINEKGKEENPKENIIKLLIEEYLEENTTEYNNDYIIDEYDEKSLPDLIYNGHNKETISNYKTKSLKFKY